MRVVALVLSVTLLPACGSTARRGGGGGGGGGGGVADEGGGAGGGVGGDVGGESGEGGGGDPAPIGDSVSVDGFCDAWRSAFVAGIEACGDRVVAQAVIAQLLADFPATCASTMAGIEQGAILYDPEAAASCLNGIGSVCILEVDVDDRLEGICGAALRGALEEDEPCYSGDECRDGRCQRGEELDCPGRCRQDASLGGACGAERECAEGLFCDDDVCIETVGEGEPCESFECEGALECMREGFDEPGVCGAPRQVGGDCPFGYECAAGLSCEEETCVAPAPRATVGEVCGGEGPGAADCVLGAHCEIPMGGVQGVCRIPAASGEPCTVGEGFDWFYGGCLSPAICVAEPRAQEGVCEATEVGDACPQATVPVGDDEFTLTRCSPGQGCDEETGRCVAGEDAGMSCRRPAR